MGKVGITETEENKWRKLALKKKGFDENATLAEVVKILRSEIEEVEKQTRDSLKAWTERASILVDMFHLSQKDAAEKLGRSQSWVSGVLRWRLGGYKQTAFGPQAKEARAKLLVTNNSVPAVRTVNGEPLDTSGFVGKAAEQLAKAIAGNDVPTQESADARKEAMGAEPVSITGTEEQWDAVTQAPPEKPSAEWFYNSSPEVAATRACHELVKRGLTPTDYLKIVLETVMLQQMNKLTRLEAGKLAGKISRQDTEAEKKAA